MNVGTLFRGAAVARQRLIGRLYLAVHIPGLV